MIYDFAFYCPTLTLFTVEKVTTDKYSFVHFEKNRYSTSPQDVCREVWLEIGTRELRILNENYAELKRMLLTPAPIIRNDKINYAAAVFQLSNIRRIGEAFSLPCGIVHDIACNCKYFLSKL